MLDPFDYKEPACALCGGKEFYAPDSEAPASAIPVGRIIDKLDGFFNSDNMEEAGKLLEYWQKEAAALNDKSGELSIVNELIGYYRKTGDKLKALAAVDRGLYLLQALGQGETVSGATVKLNAATTMKAFGKAREALPLYEQTFAVYEKKLQENDARFGGFYNNKALALADAGMTEEAEKCFLAAISIMKNIPNGQTDQAVSYVNLAHLYHSSGKEKSAVTDCLFKAYELLNDENVKKDGYYAFVCKKCAPAFGYFGYSLIEKELTRTAEDIYARA